jgi:hypothetical protein
MGSVKCAPRLADFADDETYLENLLAPCSRPRGASPRLFSFILMYVV